MTESEQKQQIVTEAVAAGELHLLIDSRQPGVQVPDGLQHAPDALPLKFSHRYDTGALTINAWGVRQRLSFGGRLFDVAVPWAAVYAARSDVKRAVWQWDKPDAPPPSAPPRAGLRLLN